jgi:hypothetical protein
MHSTGNNHGDCILVSHARDKGWEGPSKVVSLKDLVGMIAPGMHSLSNSTKKQPGTKGRDQEMESLDDMQVESIVEAWLCINPNLSAC